jgi:DNA-binding transcriptional MocR family regulator
MKQLTQKLFSYPKGLGGDPLLLTALATFFNDNNFNHSLSVKAEHVVVAAGAGACLDAVLCTICDSGDSVLVPGHSWCFQSFYLLIL